MESMETELKCEKVPFFREDDTLGCADIKFSKRPIYLQIEIDGELYRDNEGHNLFWSLKKLRRELEQKGIRLMCNGSAKNFTVSGIQSQMGAGLYGMLFNPDDSSRQKAYLFETNFDIIYATVDEQEDFLKDYVRKIDKAMKQRDPKGYEELKRKGIIREID
jgi:hypothetical protein